MNVLHIIDDQKFISICQDTFNIDGLNNTYIKSSEISVDYLKQNNIQIIFVHFLRIPEINFFSNNNISIPKVWMFWGADGFSLPLFYNNFLDKQTQKSRQIIEKKQGLKRLFVHNVKILFKDFINKITTTKTVRVINSFDYIVPIVPGDYYLLKEKYSIVPPMFHFNYVTKLFKNDNIEKNRQNIILGNSATYSNNHISIINNLKNIDIGKRKVYIPLNYGNKFYTEYILNYIKDDNRFIPMTEFLKLEDYNKIINSCEIMIMNHERQQALGNVILGLMSGNKIYLNNKSTLYTYLIECGFKVFDVNNFNINIAMSKEIIDKNIALAEYYFGKELQTNKIKELLL
ncbi:TDP-N-acetylfucosamine:lipid II N-acetylfucosaminyltransferase [Empedobacter sp. GD03865]|uniref:TDP-N-acetylfucosamine:lipid II N-acetylfucosaminyltransferase n=1 Tax=Empedobacter sp. GD03865 TaxID=2975392 RepID=UPI002448C23F|nr:TDP-N-acetylfucosamine:lipid II N-acetylfucosaminyltransferase [Empedobacter sp. GD03865]MDH0659104.1 TDP-N-acetylfucosamine:lipid II N-acetylfucosaminyltransferase [Empedobacter sp. GD03865]